MKTNKKTLESKISALEKCSNEAYLNSINLELVFSSNPRVKTRTSEAKRYASLTKELNRAKFALECFEIEEHLPDFEKMSIEEIATWADNGDQILHWCPCGIGDYECVVLHEHGNYYLAIILCSEEGWIAEAKGVRITPRLATILNQKGFNIFEN